eukprot:1339287-Amorphochlora_amoeboformis.AAC.2
MGLTRVASMGYLESPERKARRVKDRKNWVKNQLQRRLLAQVQSKNTLHTCTDDQNQTNRFAFRFGTKSMQWSNFRKRT